MGAAIAARLLQCGHEITVWNRAAEKTLPLARAGDGGARSARRHVTAVYWLNSGT